MDYEEVEAKNPDGTPLVKKRAYLYNDANAAADMIRQKLDALYKKEPDVVEEAVESIAAVGTRSKYQQYMYELSTSGKSLIETQEAWHAYYARLSDTEKREVWDEFYAANQHQPALYQTEAILPEAPETPTAPKPALNDATALGSPQVIPANTQPVVALQPQPVGFVSKAIASRRTIADLKQQITSKVRVRGKLSKKQHLQSLGFGLMMGAIVVVILLFGFFNERFIAPFITPSRNVSATPLILDPNNATVDPSPQIIIPKINIQTPAVYDVATIKEADVQAGLERGIVHYATTSNPGEQGNAVFFGHSSSNILNRGKYKFAFVLLNWLEQGDTFYVQKGGVRYVYKVFDKKIVKPSDVSVLDPVAGHASTATLITCDPPGTNVNRLVVTGDQISPSPSSNVASTAKTTDATPKVLAGNSESLWHRITNIF